MAKAITIKLDDGSVVVQRVAIDTPAEDPLTRREEAIIKLHGENEELKKVLKNTLDIMKKFDEQRAYEYLVNKCEDFKL